MRLVIEKQGSRERTVNRGGAGTFRYLGDMLMGRERHRLTLLDDGWLLISGGEMNDSVRVRLTYMNRSSNTVTIAAE